MSGAPYDGRWEMILGFEESLKSFPHKSQTTDFKLKHFTCKSKTKIYSDAQPVTNFPRFVSGEVAHMLVLFFSIFKRLL